MSFGEFGERAPLRSYAEASAHVDAPALPEPHAERNGGLQLVCYKPLFSGPAVERVTELQFQRPQAEAELSAEAAKRYGVANGAPVTLTSRDHSVTLRARVNKKLRDGIVRVPQEHAGGLQGQVEVSA